MKCQCNEGIYGQEMCLVEALVKQKPLVQAMCESDEEEGSWLSQNMPCFVGAHRVHLQQHIVN